MRESEQGATGTGDGPERPEPVRLFELAVQSEEWQEELLPALLELLGSDDPVQRSGAAWGLVATSRGNPDSAEVLIEELSLRIPRLRHREEAVAALNQIVRGARTEARRSSPKDEGPDDGDEGQETGPPSIESGGRRGDEGREPTRMRIDRRAPYSPEQFLRSLVSTSSFEELLQVEFLRSEGCCFAYRAAVTQNGMPQSVRIRAFQPPEAGDRRRFTDQFVSAVDEWSSLSDQPGWARVLDWGTKPLPWTAVETSLNGSLIDHVNVDRWKQVEVSKSILETVSQAHAQGYLHLGITPANALLGGDPVDGTSRMSFTNWGVMRAFLKTPSVPHCFGPDYLAPEVFAPEEFGEPDHETDIYGVGATLHYLFAGEAPPDERGQVGNTLPAEIRDPVLKATHREKMYRHTSAEDLEREVLEAISGLPEKDRN